MNTETHQQFLAAMQTRDLALPAGEQLVADGKWHRCAATNKASGGKDDGSYKLCLDGPVPWGLYRNWTDGKDVDYWRGGPTRPLTDTERQELERRIEQQRVEHEKEAEELATEARRQAQRIWDSAEDATADHPYLKRKQIAPHGLRVSKYGRLLVPMYGPDGKLANLQLIGDDGTKWFLKGGRARGCHFRIPGKIGPVVVAEGFATGASINEAIGCDVFVAFSGSNLAPVASMVRTLLQNADATLWKAHRDVAAAQHLEHDRRPTLVDAELIVAADDDWKTKGNPGLLAAIKAARAVRASVAVPRFDKDREDAHTDFNDIACLYGKKAVEEDLAKAAEPYAVFETWVLADPHSAHSPPIVKELAALKQSDPVQYEKLLAALKKKKVRSGALDREVKATIKTATERNEPDDADELLPHWITEPWPKSVDTRDLLEGITAQINRYVATLDNRAVVPALWVMTSYVHDAATHSPLLLVTSPEADSGKTTLLGVVGYLAKRALASVSISGPALFRSLTKWQPTFIVDEADTALVRNDDLKEVMNSGWTRGQGVIRCDPETNDPRLYATFGPKAIGMKGKKLPDTTLSRAVIIEMKRKQPSEAVADFDHLDNDEFKKLRRMLVRWANDNAAALRKAEPTIPSKFQNRTRQNWWLLLAIAELAGADIAEQTRQAAETIEQAKDRARDEYNTRLLADLKAIFDREDTDSLTSKEAVQKLTSDPEAPWATYTRNDKPMTERHLAGLLRPFGITPGTVYPEHLKGYQRWQFEEAWQRYLPADGNAAQEKTSGQTPSYPGERVNPSSTGTTDAFASGCNLENTRIENDELSYGHGDSPATRMRKGVLKKKSRFRYKPDKAARLAKASAAVKAGNNPVGRAVTKNKPRPAPAREGKEKQ